MQSVSSRIWTRVAVFISYDDNNYITGTSSVAVSVIYILGRLCIMFGKYQQKKKNITAKEKTIEQNSPEVNSKLWKNTRDSSIHSHR